MGMLRATARGVGVAVHTSVVLLAQAAVVSAACVVAEDAQACRSIDRDAIVFEATVGLIEWKDLPLQDPVAPRTAERLVRMQDIRPVKGTPQDVLVSITYRSEDCSYEFRPGQRYLIVATRLDDGRLAPSGLTRPIETSSGLRTYVQTLRQATGGELWGNVSMPARWTEWAVTYGPVPGARVTVRGPKTRTTTTDVHGEYRVGGLPWGVYTVRVDLPRSTPFLNPLAPQTVQLDPASACAEAIFTAESRSRVEGVVVDEHGQLVPRIFVSLEPADFFDPAHGPGTVPGMGVTTDSRGRYVFSDLPPVRYVVGVNIGGGPSPGSPYFEAYATTATGEVVVSLPVGGNAMLEPLRLMPAIPATVTGVVLSRTGDPVVGVYVSLWWTTVRGAAARNVITTDREGRFRLTAWEGIRYRLEVGTREAPSAQVAVPRLNEPITITLTDR